MISPRRICYVAGNTFVEAVRQRFFNFLALLCMAMVAGSLFFQQFDFGKGEIKFVMDFGFGAILFFGYILSIVVTAQLFFSEIENRTALTILAKPIKRADFIAGKFVGIALVLGTFVVMMSLLLGGVIFWREGLLMQAHPEVFSEGRLINYMEFMLYAFIQWLRFGVLIGTTMLIASFAKTNLYTVSVSFFVLLICQMQYIAQGMWAGIENPIQRALAWLISYIFPNFQLFNLSDQIALGGELGPGTFVRIIAYATVYIVASLGLAVYNFNRREI